jgi:hypothetical protein
VDNAGKQVDYRSEVDEETVLAKIDDTICAAQVTKTRRARHPPGPVVREALLTSVSCSRVRRRRS